PQPEQIARNRPLGIGQREEFALFAVETVGLGPALMGRRQPRALDLIFGDTDNGQGHLPTPTYSITIVCSVSPPERQLAEAALNRALGLMNYLSWLKLPFGLGVRAWEDRSHR